MTNWLEKESFGSHVSRKEISSQESFDSKNPFPEKLKKTSSNYSQPAGVESRQKANRSQGTSQYNKNPHLALFPLSSNQFSVDTNTGQENNSSTAAFGSPTEFTLTNERTSFSSVGLSRQLAQDNLLVSNSEKKPESAKSSTSKEQEKKLSRLRQQTKIRTDKKGAAQSKGLKSGSASSKTQNYASTSSETGKNHRIHLQGNPKPSSKLLPTVFLYIIRLLILGVGIGAIAGTILFHIDRSRPPQTANASNQTQSNQIQETSGQQNPSQSLVLGEELTSLKEKFQALAAKYPQMQVETFFVDLDNGSYVDLQGETAISAASTIKIPILIAFFEDVDAGKIRLNEMLTIQPETIGGGSGTMQYQKPGTQFSALETATKMIAISDNTATNMIIARLGGAEALNQRFTNWGLKTTVIRNLLPDLEGTNTTSPKDLVSVLAKVEKGELMSLRSRDRVLGIMRETRTRTLLPPGLEKDAIIAHKTGDIGSILADAGVIDMPSGKRYLASVMVKRPHNDYSARELIQQISKTAYQHFKWYKSGSFAKK